jgi:hypothetical protein
MTEILHLTPNTSMAIPEEIDGISYFNQRDPRWGDEPYSIVGNPDQTIGSSGCVPTTEAMVYVTYSRDLSLTPAEMAKWNLHEGFRTANSGTDSLKSLPAFAEAFHYPLEHCPPTPEDVRRVLGRGGLVYTVLHGVNRRDSLATSEAHAVLIRRLSLDGKLAAHTSESVEKSLKRDWDADEVLSLADARRTFGIYPSAV